MSENHGSGYLTSVVFALLPIRLLASFTPAVLATATTIEEQLEEPFYSLDETLDFLFRIVVMHRGPDHALQAAFSKVQQGKSGRSHIDVDVLLSKQTLDISWFTTIDSEGDDAALNSPAIMNKHTREGGETSAQLGGKLAHSLPDRVQTPVRGVIDGHTQTNHGGLVAFKVLKAIGSGVELVGREGSPISTEAAER